MHSRDSQRLAASANAFDLAVDLSVFLIKALLRYRRRCRNIGCMRRWPTGADQGLVVVSLPR